LAALKAATIERLAHELAISGQARRFKNLRLS
jgi:hypothetical protein